MNKVKSAFEWRNEPSIWTRDKELRQVAAGHALGKASRERISLTEILGKASRERISLTEKKEFHIYSKAKQSK